jgi:hypothetical protein
MELFLHNKISEEQTLWWNLYSVTTGPYKTYFWTILLLLNEITYTKVDMHYMQNCLVIIPTYIPQINKKSLKIPKG